MVVIDEDTSRDEEYWKSILMMLDSAKCIQPENQGIWQSKGPCSSCQGPVQQRPMLIYLYCHMQEHEDAQEMAL